MLDDQIARLRDPRIRRPALGVVVSYLAWVGITVLVRASSLGDGGEAQRWVAAGLMMMPIVGIAVFMVRLHAHADEVERAMHANAAAHGFVAMLLLSFLGTVLGALTLPAQPSLTLVWTVGMVAWLVGLLRAFRSYR